MFKITASFILSSPLFTHHPDVTRTHATVHICSAGRTIADVWLQTMGTMLKYSDNITLFSCHHERPVTSVCVHVRASECVCSCSMERERGREGLEGAGCRVEAEEECKAPSSARNWSICADSLRCLQQTHSLSSREVCCCCFLFRIRAIRLQVSARSRA